MFIDSLHVSNFKGIRDPIDVKLRPITVIVGPNSSGKSSILHSLAALSQTIKIVNNSKPLVLDDESASVHLGRFIDVVHTKLYTDSIELGLDIENMPIVRIGEEKPSLEQSPLSCRLEFRSTKKTQEIYLQRATYEALEHTFRFERKGKAIYFHIDDEELGEINLTESFLSDFQGFLAISQRLPHDLYSIYLQTQAHLKHMLGSVKYLGPFRQPPSRHYPTRGSNPVEVGSLGEYTITMLANETIQARARVHLDMVTQWLGVLDMAKNVNVSRMSKSDLFSVNFQLPDTEEFSIADLGYGFSQILPVLTQCSFANEGDTLLFEQPELHLHPLAASKLPQIFIDTWQNRQAASVVETHSSKFVGGLINRVREGAIQPDEVAIYSVRRVSGCSVIEPIELIDQDGEIDTYDNWRKSFTEE